MEERQEEITATTNLEDGMTPTVLIAEDSKFFMSQIRGFMEDSGYNVITAEDGQIAYDKLMENPESVNIVLTDIEMPNMDGFEFTEQVREDARFDELPILAVTSIAGAAAEQRGMEVGLDEYLIKLDRDEILEKCSYYLKNGRKHT
jgi:two-component system chemotaxis sensor kinase CheA